MRAPRGRGRTNKMMIPDEKEPLESRVSSRRNGKMQYERWRVNDSGTNTAHRQKAPTITTKDGMQEVLQPRCTLSATFLRPGNPNRASLLLCIYSLVPRSFPLFSLSLVRPGMNNVRKNREIPLWVKSLCYVVLSCRMKIESRLILGINLFAGESSLSR